MSKETITKKPVLDPVSASGLLILDDVFCNENITKLVRTIKYLNMVPKDKQPKRITIEINSPGGEIWSLTHLLNAMEESKIPVDTKAVGLAASCGCVLLMAGAKRYAVKEADIMSHQYSAGIYGKEHELEGKQKSLRVMSKRMITWYKKFTGKDEAYVRKHLLGATDVWLTSSEAKKHGIIDKII